MLVLMKDLLVFHCSSLPGTLVATQQINRNGLRYLPLLYRLYWPLGGSEHAILPDVLSQSA
jgi:hypothetical protein